jgi:hypothetical protein
VLLFQLFGIFVVVATIVGAGLQQQQQQQQLSFIFGCARN